MSRLPEKFFDRPNVVGKFRGHCGGAFDGFSGTCGFDFESGMDAAEVEMGDEEGDGVFEVFEFFGVAECEAGEAAVEDSDGEVCAFDVGRAHVFGAWGAANDRLTNANEWAGGILAFGEVVFVWVGILLDDLGEVNFVEESEIHLGLVRAESIGGKLERGFDALAEVEHEFLAGDGGTLAGGMIDDEFGV